MVSDYAKNFLPDIVDGDGIVFKDILLDTYSTDSSSPTFSQDVGLFVEGDDTCYLPTEWSRAQLLKHLGTREKWFEPVPYPQQAAELNARRETFEDQVLKIMRDPEDPTSKLQVLRGLVSRHYRDIPNTAVLSILKEAVGDLDTVSLWSGITDRAFYCTVVVSDATGIAVGTAEAFPAMVLRNSEVGYTSLWAIPALFLPEAETVLLTENSGAYRRAHRGKDLVIDDELREILEGTKGMWGPLAEKIAKLKAYAFPDEDLTLAAIAHLTRAFPKYLQYRVQQVYKKQHHQRHHAGHILDAAIEACSDVLPTLDRRYERGVLAGTILFGLLGMIP